MSLGDDCKLFILFDNVLYPCMTPRGVVLTCKFRVILKLRLCLKFELGVVVKKLVTGLLRTYNLLNRKLLIKASRENRVTKADLHRSSKWLQ